MSASLRLFAFSFASPKQNHNDLVFHLSCWWKACKLFKWYSVYGIWIEMQFVIHQSDFLFCSISIRRDELIYTRNSFIECEKKVCSTAKWKVKWLWNVQYLWEIISTANENNQKGCKVMSKRIATCCYCGCSISIEIGKYVHSNVSWKQNVNTSVTAN